jgi:hypothetical protein
MRINFSLHHDFEMGLVYLNPGLLVAAITNTEYPAEGQIDQSFPWFYSGFYSKRQLLSKIVLQSHFSHLAPSKI